MYPITPAGQSSWMDSMLGEEVGLIRILIAKPRQKDSLNNGAVAILTGGGIVRILSVKNALIGVLVVRGGHSDNFSPTVGEEELTIVRSRRAHRSTLMNGDVNMVSTLRIEPREDGLEFDNARRSRLEGTSKESGSVLAGSVS